MNLQTGVYHLFLPRASYHLGDIDQDGQVLNVSELVKVETLELIASQIQRGINKAEQLTCVTLDTFNGKAKYVDLVRLLVDGVEKEPGTANVQKAKRVGKTAEQQRRSRTAQALLKKSNLTKRELSNRLGVTFQKVKNVMEGRTALPPSWATFLRNSAKNQHTHPTPQDPSQDPLEPA